MLLLTRLPSRENLCAPCFSDGKTGVPLRLPDGNIEQGMAGSIDPGPEAEANVLVRKRLSANGSHFVFGSTAQFEAGASSGNEPSIYDRNLKSGTTAVVSKLPNGENIPCLSNCNSDGIAELDISEDGSRILIGQLVSTDSAGNHYWHLYMDVADSPKGIDLMPGSTSGALYNGMSADGSEVYFTTDDALNTAANQDTDTSADIYRAEVSGSGSSLTRVSTGSEETGNTDACDPGLNNDRSHWNSTSPSPNCDAVAIGGGGGVASASGDIYFLSPELLDGTSNGVENAPNVYLARVGSEPEYVTTLESSLDVPQPPPTGHPLIRHFGSLTKPSGLALDSTHGYIYYLEPGVFSGTVSKFDTKGHPDQFHGSSEAGGNQLTGVDTQLAR